MADNFGNKKNSNGFDKNPQNINKTGQNRKLVSDTIKSLEEKGVKPATKSEIQDVYLRLINLDIPQLENELNDDNNSALVRIVAKAILNDKGFEIIEKMLDRSIGKAEQKTDITSGGEQITINLIKGNADKS
jgi:hypothetical protein